MIVTHKTNHLVDVLSLRLTEQHYAEACGWSKTVNADCSWELNYHDKR